MTVKANLNRLSLPAPANCVQKKGAKRRCRSSANWLGCPGEAAGTVGSATAVLCMLSSSGGLRRRRTGTVPLRKRQQPKHHRDRGQRSGQVLERVARDQPSGCAQDDGVVRL